MVHFQTMPNAFEVFGLDYLVDESGRAWLLEINAFPDYRQTGEELKDLVGGLWEGVVRVFVGGFFGVRGKENGKSEVATGRGEEEGSMVLVRSLDLGRR